PLAIRSDARSLGTTRLLSGDAERPRDVECAARAARVRDEGAQAHGFHGARRQIDGRLRRIDRDRQYPQVLDLALRREARIGILARGQQGCRGDGEEAAQNATLTPAATLKGTPWKVACC